MPQATTSTGTSAPTASLVAAPGDHCPSCSAHLAPDQRYCLECGMRRGDPRLPFMDAVVFMDAVKRPAAAAPPPPPSRKEPRISANASLIAGVGTLLLALGIGVLIGKSGDSGAGAAATAAPQVIKVGGGAETASTAAPTESAGAAKAKSKAKGKAKDPATATGSSGTSEAAEKVLKPSADVKLPPPTVQPGGDCESGAAGCEGGEFTGEFFGE